jgi:hypothetical protein
MMATIYQQIGKVMVRYWLVRYRREIRIAAGIATAAGLAAGYAIATRQPPEG